MGMRKKIKEANKKYMASCSVASAMALCDSFSKHCMASEPIPHWALALRALTARVRLQARRIEQLEIALDKANQQIV